MEKVITKLKTNTKVQQSMTRIISLANENWSHLKLELSKSFCSTNWPKSVTKFVGMTVVKLVTPKAAA